MGNSKNASGWDDDDQDDDHRASSSSNSYSQYDSITRPVQRHLTRVYGTLGAVSAAATAGSVLYLRDLVPIHPQTAMFLGLLVILGVQFTRSQASNPSTQLMRLGGLIGFGALQGVAIGPLVEGAMYLNSSIVPQALASSLLIFGSFTASAMASQRRSYIYSGGLLMSALSVLMMMSLANVFFRSDFVFSMELYLGLLAFSGFVAYDTQMIVERALAGDRDYVSHGADLFQDLFAIVVRILAILTRKEDDRDRKRRK